jgi:hypothetical protein
MSEALFWRHRELKVAISDICCPLFVARTSVDPRMCPIDCAASDRVGARPRELLTIQDLGDLFAIDEPDAIRNAQRQETLMIGIQIV